MELPLDVFLMQLKEKRVYFFKDGVNLNNFVNEHLHICIKQADGNIAYFVCCTTKKATIENFLSRRKISLSTMVEIPHNDVFDQDTYINCNNIYSCTEDEFAKLYENGALHYIGDVEQNKYSQLPLPKVRGLCKMHLTFYTVH